MISSSFVRVVNLWLILSFGHVAQAFVVVGNQPLSFGTTRKMYLPASTTPTTATTANKKDTYNMVSPLTFDEMIRQCSSAMRDAVEQASSSSSDATDSTRLPRQIIRVLLPRDATSGNLGLQYEPDAATYNNNIVLAPPDETWQGGIMQLYRACVPTIQELLRSFYLQKNTGGLPPRMMEDRSIDESGVDGIGLWTTARTVSSTDKNDSTSTGGVTIVCQPSQETVDVIESLCKKDESKNELIVLMNPQWRNVDDALDAASRDTSSFWGSFASFLGGKGNSLKRLDDLGFINTYIVEQYVCKGGNVRLQKRFDTDWHIFAENDAGTDFIPVGTSPHRPTYQEVDAMLDAKGISLKYARDMGMAPKL